MVPGQDQAAGQDPSAPNRIPTFDPRGAMGSVPLERFACRSQVCQLGNIRSLLVGRFEQFYPGLVGDAPAGFDPQSSLAHQVLLVLVLLLLLVLLLVLVLDGLRFGLRFGFGSSV
jgi:hypothetical protein